jgi:hypothetical protein
MSEKTKKPARPQIVTATEEELRQTQCPDERWKAYRAVVAGQVRFTWAGSSNEAVYFVAKTLGKAYRLDQMPTKETVLSSFMALTPEDQAILIARLHAADGSAAGPAPAAPSADKAPAVAGKGGKK